MPSRVISDGYAVAGHAPLHAASRSMTSTDDPVREQRADRSDGGDGRALRPSERRTLAYLGVPSLVLALAVTVVTTYLPVNLHAGQASTTMIGLLIGTEGLVALTVPLVVGAWSDQVRALGGRLPFILGGLPPLVVSLTLLGLVTGLGAAAVLLVVFFASYYACYEPYRAMYPDVTEDEIAGRAQSSQALFRGLGTFLALVGGGLLLGLGEVVPFAVAAATALLGIGAFVLHVVRARSDRSRPREDGGVGRQARRLWLTVRSRPELRLYLICNALWELSLGALKTFVVLYLTIGLGLGLTAAALIIGAVALLLLVASPVSGTMGDRHGRVRIMQWSLAVYGIGLLVPFLVASKAAIAVAVPFIAIGGGVVMTLPYALLMPLMDDEEHGALTGFYSVSRGIGTSVGPLLAGAAISLTSGVFDATKGFQATWGVCAAAVLASLLPLRRLRRLVGDQAGG